MRRVLFLVRNVFFQIQLDHSVPMLVKNALNTWSAKTYYINHLTRKNCMSVNNGSSIGQLTD